MKNLRRALAFSATLLLAAGCPKKGVEPPERADASPSATPSEAQVGAAEQALQDAGAPQAAATGEEDGGTAFERSDSPAAGAAAPPKQGSARIEPRTVSDAGSTADAGGANAAREACVDRWLASRKLDRYGSKQGTMYTGGTPLFDERTGETRDRLEYVFSRYPEAKAACPQ